MINPSDILKAILFTGGMVALLGTALVHQEKVERQNHIERNV